MEYSNNNKLNQQSNEAGNQKQNFTATPPQKSNHNVKIIIGILSVLLIASISAAGFYVYKNKTATKNGPIILEDPLNYSVVVKENPTDKTKSDIYLKDPKTGQETFYITLSKIDRISNLNAEYHNGNLYIIHLPDGDPNFAAELWRYNQQKQGVKLYSTPGLDFRVSDDEKFIAIIAGNLTFINNDGVVLKNFSSDQVGVENFDPIKWSNSNFWVSNHFGPAILNIVKIDAINFQTTKFDLSDMCPSSFEFDLNPIKEKIACSDYIFQYTSEDGEEYERSGAKVNLFVYDLNSKSQQIIATSITSRFEPQWLDENTLEYNNPNGTGRLIKQIP